MAANRKRDQKQDQPNQSVHAFRGTPRRRRDRFNGNMKQAGAKVKDAVKH